MHVIVHQYKVDIKQVDYDQSDDVFVLEDVKIKY